MSKPFYLACFIWRICALQWQKQLGKTTKLKKKNPNYVAIGTGSSSLKDEN
jgi:hypothetical protein